ncbi:hypothetical protein Avbf_00723 [Armadillidium vulgare]|nr:hypothetical protein Avbf_00723 [Armadillidium vulgare]
MADKNTKEDHNNTLNANPNEEQQEHIEIDEELLNFFRNGTDNRVPQDGNQPANEPTEGVQNQDGLTSEMTIQDEISSLMEENALDDFDPYPPDDFDGEMWNIEESESLSFIKLPFAF